MLAPRFYTTDFAAVDGLKITPENRQMWDDILAEFRRDPNKDHFKRNADFDADFSAMDPKLREQFIDFLVSSVTAEFSGCILLRRSEEAHQESRRARAVRVHEPR